MAFEFQREFCHDVASSLANVSDRPPKQESGLISKDLGETIANESAAQSAFSATGAFARIGFVGGMDGHSRIPYTPDILRCLLSAFFPIGFNLTIPRNVEAEFGAWILRLGNHNRRLPSVGHSTAANGRSDHSLGVRVHVEDRFADEAAGILLHIVGLKWYSGAIGEEGK